MSDIRSADVSVASVFSAVDVAFACTLVVVAIRVGPGEDTVPFSVGPYIIVACSLISIVGFIFAVDQAEFPIGGVFAAQSIVDLAAWFLSSRAASNGLIRGTYSIWRAVVSSAMTLLSTVFVTDMPECQGLLSAVLFLRILWIVTPLIETKCLKTKSTMFLDEWGLLWNIMPSGYGSRVFVTLSTESDDPENPQGTSLTESLMNSRLSGLEGIPSSSRNSDSTTDSSDSVPLIRPASNGLERLQLPLVVGPHAEYSSSLSQCRPADDAAGPRPSQPIQTSQELPNTIRVIAHREVLTTGGVPLVVYVLQTDRNEVLVHRYGEFRALCKRVVSKFYHEHGNEPPLFPGRRVFRKFIPQSMGGIAQGASADREFIANRANALGEWTQQVIQFVKSRAENQGVVLALLEFLQPVVRCSPDSDIDQVVRSAVLIFSDTVLNAVPPPTPSM